MHSNSLGALKIVKMPRLLPDKPVDLEPEVIAEAAAAAAAGSWAGPAWFGFGVVGEGAESVADIRASEDRHMHSLA